jgi:transcriptional regulator GlxA family with amidase domain
MRPVPNQPKSRLPVALADQIDLVNQAVGFFADHFSEAIELESMAEALGVNGDWLDLCFDHCRGKTPFQSLQHLRLSRLFEGIAAEPHSTLQQQVDRCGLASVMGASKSFEQLFGIGLAPFRRMCRRAAQDRQMTSMDLPYPNRA